MRRSISVWFAALISTLNLAVTGCGGTAWPQVRAQSDRAFASRPEVITTIDILPADLQVWTQPDSEIPADNVAAIVTDLSHQAVASAIAKRGYQIAAQIDWDGTYAVAGGTREMAMPVEHVEVTAHSLSSYGHAVTQAQQGLLIPYLPHRLGTRTGADATLYIGGWAYWGAMPAEHSRNNIARGLGISLLVLAAAVVAVAVLKSSGNRSAAKVAKTATAAGRTAARAAVTAGKVAGRVVRPALRHTVRATPKLLRGMAHVADAFGRASTHILVYGGRPGYYYEEYTPKQGRSQMQIELTLVDNHTGLVLWHARNTFPAHPTAKDHVDKVFAHLLATLPQR